MAVDTLIDDLQKLVCTNCVAFMFLGNPIRGEDQIAINIREHLMQKSIPDKFLLINAYTVPVNFFGQLVKFKPSTIIFVDTIDAKLESGSVLLLNLHEFQDLKSYSTHFQGFDQITDHLKNRLGDHVKIYLLGYKWRIQSCLVVCHQKGQQLRRCYTTFLNRL